MALSDRPLQSAYDQVAAARRPDGARPCVAAFFDPATFTVSYVVSDPASKCCAIIDSVLDFDPASGRTGLGSANTIIDHVRAEGLRVDWVLETHAHADHLSAAPYLQAVLGGTLAIGEGIVEVQAAFGDVFNTAPGSPRDGSDFGRLFGDGDTFCVGGLAATALHVPGHTPADVAYIIGEAAFVGDTLFMPDFGTARTDFPGGDAQTLYASIRRLLELPPETRMFLCHDYKAPGRDVFAWETTVAAQRAQNIHVRDAMTEADFVALRRSRDSELSPPKLILPAVQVNIRGGRLPDPEANGVRYLKIPIDSL